MGLGLLTVKVKQLMLLELVTEIYNARNHLDGLPLLVGLRKRSQTLRTCARNQRARRPSFTKWLKLRHKFRKNVKLAKVWAFARLSWARAILFASVSLAMH